MKKFIAILITVFLTSGVQAEWICQAHCKGRQWIYITETADHPIAAFQSLLQLCAETVYSQGPMDETLLFTEDKTGAAEATVENSCRLEEPPQY